jgi:lysophospholipase L1-like esterase
MHASTIRSSILLTVSLSCLAARSQSLSIIRSDQSQLWIQSSAPAGARYALQVSKDMNSWLNVNDSVSGTVSNQVGKVAASARYFRLVPWTDPPPITMVLVGDSTMADFTVNLSHFYGWGQGFYGYFNSSALIVNLAYPGLSSKSFLGSDQEAQMLVIKPNYVFLELCYEDAFGPPERATTLSEYETNLNTIVQEVRSFNGTPILLTPQGLWVFNDQDQTGPAYPDRNAVIEKVGAEQQVYVIDLSTLSINLLNQLGKNGSAYLFSGDWLHFSQTGSDTIAGLVAGALPPYFGPYLLTDKVLSF